MRRKSRLHKYVRLDYYNQLAEAWVCDLLLTGTALDSKRCLVTALVEKKSAVPYHRRARDQAQFGLAYTKLIDELIEVFSA
jgi:hypothetical protein